MKKIMFVLPKHKVALSYPDWANFIMKRLYGYLKVEVFKPTIKGRTIDIIYLDEAI